MVPALATILRTAAVVSGPFRSVTKGEGKGCADNRAESPQGAYLGSPERVGGWHSVLEPGDAQQALLEIIHVPAQ